MRNCLKLFYLKYSQAFYARDILDNKKSTKNILFLVGFRKYMIPLLTVILLSIYGCELWSMNEVNISQVCTALGTFI